MYANRNGSRDAFTKLVLEIFRLNGELIEVGDALVDDIGLTSARWQVLGAIALATQPLPVAHLARNMGLARQSVQRIVDDLKKDGLVLYAPNQHHRRAMLVLMTAAGKAAYEVAMKRQKKWADSIVTGLSPQVMDTARNTLVELRRRLEENAKVPPEKSGQQKSKA